MGCRVLPGIAIPAYISCFSSKPCSVLRGVALPVVSAMVSKGVKVHDDTPRRLDRGDVHEGGSARVPIEAFRAEPKCNHHPRYVPPTTST
jgi:hypothetical protein